MIDVQNIDHKAGKKVIDKARNKIRDNKIVEGLFDDYEVSIDELDTIPMAFANIPVSARTEHGCIYFNKSLMEQPEELEHYMVHEITHYLQQSTGSRPIRGTSGDGGESYLDNEHEIEGFQNQIAYISDRDSKKDAEKYVEQVLDHHEIDGKKRKKKKKELLDG